ncbi:trihelix transcription factor ASR3-like [Gastrolobium bilobum]|uniref:trihelix transcription factor ASR3-like n=1 Tax=Gastrolobium bilobum TaxID=150636 RepID=UPI002AB072A6|nr:trihelix transcription factor ASR3-like [Gastrolobium bilobum]
MALEQKLSLGQNTNPVDEADGNANGVDARLASTEGGDEGGKAPRLPRWTRQEILVLIQGKRDAENKFRRGRTAGLPFGSGQVEPKWASVSSYCRKHGVNRGPVQCRKRWSNLAGDYKKIKEWESQIREETESFWVMRNDLRRERKLPGFFDKEVYDILDSGSQAPALALALSSTPATVTEPVGNDKDKDKDKDNKRVADEDYTEPHLYDSNRSAVGEDGLFSDFEQEEVGASPEKKNVLAPSKDIPAPIPISEKQYQPLLPGCQGEGVNNDKQQASNPEMGSAAQGELRRKRLATEGEEMGSASQGQRKRKRLATDGEEETSQYQLIDVLERNGKMLSAQLEVQNINFQLDREQRKDHANNLVAVLDKLADALGRIAEKL